MKINLQTVRFKASEDLEILVSRQLEKLDRHSDHILHADVTLYEESTKKPHHQFCEITLTVKGKSYFVKKNEATYERSLHESVDALLLMLKKDKDQFEGRRRNKGLNE